MRFESKSRKTLPVPVYFASDMHLRLDRPDRALRLASWVETLSADDTLHLVGDVCDFLYATRQRTGREIKCMGLRSLAEFKERGGKLTVLVGNHDSWLGPYYQEVLGAELVTEPRILDVHSLRFHIVHGHRVGGRQPWKASMESRAFFEAFRGLPNAVASKLDRILEGSNDRGRSDDEARLIEIYRESLPRIEAGIDIALFGHVHSPLDDSSIVPRMVVLGGWHHRTSYLRVDPDGASLVVEDPAKNPVRA